MTINKGMMLAPDASGPEIVSVVNELIGDYKGAEPIANNETGLTFVTQGQATAIWILLCAYLVFFMHAGFSMLEAGSVRHKNAVNIMFKNIATVAVGGFCYYLLGFAFAFGSDNKNEANFGFIGSGNYALHGAEDNRHFWFFQFAFAATGATIVSGAVAGRVMIEGYLIIAAWITTFVYPVVSHWIWATGGFMSAFTEDTMFSESGGCGVLDYAGSGVVHMTGGIAGLWAAYIVGPRLGRYGPDGIANDIPPHNMAIVTLGTFILWFGWYGFNCGSTLAFDELNAAKAATTTTLSPAMAVLTAVIISRPIFGHYELAFVLNSALGGLVGITAGCTVVDDWAALIIGIISCLVYAASSKLIKMARIDDPVDAISVHGACGFWGLLAVGIFATPANIMTAYGRECAGWTSGLQFGSQLVGAIVIFCWVSITVLPVLLLLKVTSILRVPPQYEEIGLDHSEHGGQRAFIGAEEPVEAVEVKDEKDNANKSAAETTQVPEATKESVRQPGEENVADSGKAEETESATAQSKNVEAN